MLKNDSKSPTSERKQANRENLQYFEGYLSLGMVSNPYQEINEKHT
jgi:hypothetical protein